MENELPSLKHLGIILDGNGRWAQKRGLRRTLGHSEGLKALKRIIRYLNAIKLPFLSLYVFSAENWKRSRSEIDYLMLLIKSNLSNYINFYIRNGIRIWHSGELSGLPVPLQKEIELVVEKTKDLKEMTLNLLINYSGQLEIVQAAERLRQREEQITIESLRANIYHGEGLPPCDMIIRSGGETRLSNFLLWDSAYAELFFIKKFWPDLRPEDIQEAIESFRQRDRRYGSA